jgi:hypothetical protein
VVERTKARIALASAPQFDTFRDDVDNFEPGFDLINRGHRNLGHGIKGENESTSLLVTFFFSPASK